MTHGQVAEAPQALGLGIELAWRDGVVDAAAPHHLGEVVSARAVHADEAEHDVRDRPQLEALDKDSKSEFTAEDSISEF